jgi:hypothetical protein
MPMTEETKDVAHFDLSRGSPKFQQQPTLFFGGPTDYKNGTSAQK